MAVNETGQIDTDDRTSNSQASLSSSVGQTNPARSGLPAGGFHSQSNSGAETNQNVSRLESDEADYNRHQLTGYIRFSAGNGAAQSQLMQDDSIAQIRISEASLRKLSSLSGASRPLLDKDLEDDILSQAGDIENRIASQRESQRDSFQFDTEQDAYFPISDEPLDPWGFGSNDPNKCNTDTPVAPLVSEITTPLITTPLLSKKQDEKKELPPFLEYISYLVHLAVFGILGIITRYLLQKLFSSTVIGMTSDQSILYLDLPSNMVGSFLMGWFGVVFKGKISHMSDQLAIGLSTGYLGSLTTFSGWNQKMLDLSVNGHCILAVLGFVIGLFLAAYSIIIGIETAKGFRWLLERSGRTSRFGELRVNSFKSHLIVLALLTLVWGGLWTTSGILEIKEFSNGGSWAQLWLGCLVGPLGVWSRWWLARLNGHGLGKAARWCWIPFGTFAANVSAASVMAALATTKKVVNTKNCDTVAGGIQLGLMGCLSTVSTFMAEYNGMRESSEPWRAYTYAFITIAISFSLGTLIYTVPMWTLGYT